ncbi:hypothetical protein [Acinetobacter baumannii]|uniref:hypothetical protein n=1 Tax=Acinetobacter baumannii TaxID=470 RepID=UPI0029575AF2|nr:hypothetical protein [Acinetobacter baumannii]
MTDNQKHHHFMFSAVYKERNDGPLQFHFGTFSFPFKNITKNMLKQVEEQTLQGFKQNNPEDEVYEYKLVSMSYLGEMTHAEFNS